MTEVIKQIEKVIGNSRDKDAADIAIYMLIEASKDKHIELDKKYFVSEWSWSPICDGIFVYEEQIRDSKQFKDSKAYCTTKNYRTYMPYDIYENEEDCQVVTDFKNSFGYDWEIQENTYKRNNNINCKLGKWM